MKYPTKQKRLVAIFDGYIKAAGKTAATAQEAAEWAEKMGLVPVPRRGDEPEVCLAWEQKLEQAVSSVGIMEIGKDIRVIGLEEGLRKYGVLFAADWFRRKSDELGARAVIESGDRDIAELLKTSPRHAHAILVLLVEAKVIDVLWVEHGRDKCGYQFLSMDALDKGASLALSERAFLQAFHSST